MRLALVALVALVAVSALGCDDRARLGAPEIAPVKTPKNVDLGRVEIVGKQRPELVDLYLRRAFARVFRLCRPKAHTTARVVLTIDRVGHITELGLESSAPGLALCARKHVEKQRFPKVKGRTLASAEIEFLE